MKVKKNISLEEDLKNKATKKAKIMGMSFSAYITYLINKDLGEIAITEEVDNSLNKRVSSAIDNVMGTWGD